MSGMLEDEDRMIGKEQYLSMFALPIADMISFNRTTKTGTGPNRNTYTNNDNPTYFIRVFVSVAGSSQGAAAPS